jgi:hypothetical protein
MGPSEKKIISITDQLGPSGKAKRYHLVSSVRKEGGNPSHLTSCVCRKKLTDIRTQLHGPISGVLLHIREYFRIVFRKLSVRAILIGCWWFYPVPPRRCWTTTTGPSSVVLNNHLPILHYLAYAVEKSALDNNTPGRFNSDYTCETTPSSFLVVRSLFPGEWTHIKTNSWPDGANSKLVRFNQRLRQRK